MKITQMTWRATGTVTLTVSAAMAVTGSEWEALRMFLREHPGLFLLYWGVCGLMIALSFYCAFLDLRYIRLRYAAERRTMFLKTLGDEAIRKAVNDACQKEAVKKALERNRQN
jgi:hypothetical protein